MRTLIMVGTFCLFTVFCLAQESTMSFSKTQLAFSERFSQVDLIESGITKDKKHIFNFYDKDVYKEAYFDHNGNWLMTRSEIDAVHLPLPIVQQIKLKYPKFKYENSHQIDCSYGQRFEVQIFTESLVVSLLFDGRFEIIEHRIDFWDTNGAPNPKVSYSALIQNTDLDQ